MNYSQIKKFLNYLKIKKYHPVNYKKCEICNCKKTKEITLKSSWGNNKWGVLPVHCCVNCGFIFQNPRFDKHVYQEYYNNAYRNITLESIKPPKTFLDDQKKRGELLFKFIKKYIPKKGSMLDVGCSAGMMLLPFLRNGWKCSGNDPVESHIEYGRNKYQLSLEAIQAEDMVLKKNSLDLIIIMGSLEHVYDMNIVMEKCEKAIKKNGILVLEARGNPLGYTKNYFNLSHHRYFYENTMQLTMRKYGWEPFLTTTYPITGDSRENTQFCIGKYKGNNIKKTFKSLIKNGKRETYLDMFYKFKYFNYRAKNIKHLIAKIGK